MLLLANTDSGRNDRSMNSLGESRCALGRRRGHATPTGLQPESHIPPAVVYECVFVCACGRGDVAHNVNTTANQPWNEFHSLHWYTVTFTITYISDTSTITSDTINSVILGLTGWKCCQQLQWNKWFWWVHTHDQWSIVRCKLRIWLGQEWAWPATHAFQRLTTYCECFHTGLWIQQLFLVRNFHDDLKCADTHIKHQF